MTARTAERLVGSAVNYAYATKAGPFVFLNGHEGYDFEAEVVLRVVRELVPTDGELGAKILRPAELRAKL